MVREQLVAMSAARTTWANKIQRVEAVRTDELGTLPLIDH
jgi:hypothetical protein